MNFSDKAYNTFMIPLEAIRLRRLRKRLIPLAKGNVLEIGAGTGVNFRYYNSHNVESLTIMDLQLRESIQKYPFTGRIDAKFVAGNVMEIPFKNETFDTVVFTLLFCSVDDPLKGLEEVKRVLKPKGKILFMEHVLPEKQPLKKTFHHLNHTWMKISKECRINRETLKSIEAAGYHIERIERHLQGVIICGVARKKL